MIDPEITLPLRDRVDAAGEPVHEFVVAGHNDDFALEVDSLTLVGRVDPERGPAQAIAVEAPLELVDGALKVTIPEVELPEVGEAPIDGLTYGRKDGDWQEAVPYIDADDVSVAVNAVFDGGVWRYKSDGAALAIGTSPGTQPALWPAITGVAGDPIAWGPAIRLGTGNVFLDGQTLNVTGAVIASGGMTAGGQIISNAGGWALHAPNGGLNVGWDIHSGAAINAANRMSCGDIGIETTLGGAGHWYAFHWNGNAFINVNNAVGWLQLTNQCDERLKQDIAPTRFDCLAAVEAIPLYQFRWRDNSTPGDIKPVGATPETLVPIGLVAQRVEEVAPSLIVKPPAPPSTASSDAPFNPMQIETNNMFALLLGAIKQLAARVEHLEART